MPASVLHQADHGWQFRSLQGRILPPAKRENYPEQGYQAQHSPFHLRVSPSRAAVRGKDRRGASQRAVPPIAANERANSTAYSVREQQGQHGDERGCRGPPLQTKRSNGIQSTVSGGS